MTLLKQKIEDYFTQNLESYLDLHRQMVEINSFTANAAGVNKLGDLTAQLFARLGFQAETVQSVMPDYGRHLFLKRTAQDKSAPTIALVSHLDTVFPPEEEQQHNFFWRREGRRIYGPGAVDIKGGTVMILMVLDALKQFAPAVSDQTSWLVCLDASEERLSEDFASHCLQRLPDCTAACLVFEGGNISGKDFLLVTARKGRASLRVTVEGRSAHAGNNHAMGANAIVQLAHTIQELAALTDYKRDLTFNVGSVSGGVVTNRVPHYAEALLEMRAFDTEVFETGLHAALALNGVSTVSSEDGFACRVLVEVLDRSAPWSSNPATEELFDIWKETAQTLGMSVSQEQRGGLSDGNYLWQHFPTLDGMGPAGNYSHCSERDPASGKDQEYVSIPSFVPKATLNCLAVLNLLERSGRVNQ